MGAQAAQCGGRSRQDAILKKEEDSCRSDGSPRYT